MPLDVVPPPAADLIIFEIKVAPNNGTFGDSLVPSQGGTLQVTIKNQGQNATGVGFNLHTWIHVNGPLLIPVDTGDFIQAIPALDAGASFTTTYSVTSFASVSGLYIPRGMLITMMRSMS
jgi:hypothetical protein